ncbi:MAG: 1,4-dihydroxy-2-naphthoate octaprenyltransferase [Anaerolineales bacterium]|nr:1,4-dihydroxy-2-naphthoate octaprenyltransferase [Anaerolineales bacterium]
MKWQAWYQATRPRSLTATYVPVALGAVMAWEADHFRVVPLVLALLGVLFLQISANMLNEYFDYAKGSDSQKTHGLGMILARGLLTPRQVLAGGIVTLLLGVVIGLYFVATAGWLVLWLGVGGTLAVVLYTAGPYPLAYIGMGELTVFFAMGPMIVLGTYYVIAEEATLAAVWASLPIAFLVANILHANNLRDLEADAAEQKYTLATIFGRRFAQMEYTVLTAGAFLSVGVLIGAGIAPFLTVAVVYWGREAWRLIHTGTHTTDAAQLHLVLVGTARLHKLFGMVYVGAWLVQVAVEKLT